ncbi:hypothetical protein CEB3_c50480 [Peptococcaceae bacterium CEB3]|nr:hypothetical protein CEB3_c50480 [Peptococcaceae bacterium CEB3]
MPSSLLLLGPDGFSYAILTFASYAFAGWILETLYRSLSEKRLVNPGFLKGPFLPLYGSFGLLATLTSPWVSALGWEGRFLYFVVLSTTLEYISGLCLEHLFHLRLWDYQNTPLNFQGRVALPYSLLWGALGIFLSSVIQPRFSFSLLGMPSTLRFVLSLIFIVYLIWDVIQSSLLLRRLALIIIAFERNHGHRSYERLVLILRPFRRLLSSYPKLRDAVSEIISLIQAKHDS